MSAGPAGGGPVRPTATAHTVLRPLASTARAVTGGLWAQRLRTNREVALAVGRRRLDDAGNLDDLTAAARGTGGPYRGPVFMDSDVYKWLEAVAWELGRAPSQELLAALREVSDVVASAQQPDGYLNSFVQVTRGGADRYRDLATGHELYCVGHLIQAGVAVHRATSETVLWDVAVRAADHLVDTFGPSGLTGLDGHPVVEMALVELHRETGDPRHLQLAAWFVDRRGHGLVRHGTREPIYFSDRVPAREAVTLEGHAVRALYLAAGVADVAAESGAGGDGLRAAQQRQWDHLLATKTYVTGGMGSRWDGEAFGDPYELPPDVAYCETCAAIGAVQWAWRRLLETGDPACADLVERILLNGFLSGISLSGDEFFYVNALQVRTGAVPDDHRQPANGREGWFHTACCPPNVMRTLSSLGSYLATTDDTGLQVHQFATGELDDGERGVAVTTDYPWEGTVTAEVTRTGGRPWTLSLRVPAWARGATVAVAGEPARPVEAVDGYVRVHRGWRVGEQVRLELPLPVRVERGDPRVDAVRGARVVRRGPLVYAVEQVDLPQGTVLEDLDLTGTDPSGWPVRRRPELLGDVVTVDVPLTDRTTGAPLVVTAVPYAVWANRGVGPMRVWLPVAERAVGTVAAPDAVGG